MEDIDQNQQVTLLKEAGEFQMMDQNAPISTRKQDIRSPTTKLLNSFLVDKGVI